MTLRILVTGSRDWADPALIASWLAGQAGDETDVVVVHGGCPDGADAQAEQAARILGYRTEPHPADWEGPCRPPACPPLHRRRRKDGTDYCPAAGPYRNQEMADAGAGLCLAFFWPGAQNRGTADCVRRAQKAGIPVRRVRPGS